MPRFTCPKCQHTFKTTPRICARCGKGFSHSHKWQYITANGASVIVHRHCDNPEAYYSEAQQVEIKKLEAKGIKWSQIRKLFRS